MANTQFYFFYCFIFFVFFVFLFSVFDGHSVLDKRETDIAFINHP